MNTKDNWLTTATIHDQNRRAIWGTIFPDAIVPIKSIFPQPAELPGYPHADVYLLDLDAISDEQCDQLVNVIHKLFGLEEEDVRKDIAARGVPILAEGVSVSTRDQGMMFSMIGDDFDGQDPAPAGAEEWDEDDDEHL